MALLTRWASYRRRIQTFSRILQGVLNTEEKLLWQLGPWKCFEQECADICKSLRETRSWDDDPSHPQARHLGLGGPNGKEERGRGSWLQEEMAAMPGTVAEPAVGVGNPTGKLCLKVRW